MIMSVHNQAINRGYGKAWRKCNNALAHTMHFQYFISSEYKNKYWNDQFSSRNFVERNLIILSGSKNPRNKITLSFQFLNRILRALLCFVIWQLRFLQINDIRKLKRDQNIHQYLSWFAQDFVYFHFNIWNNTTLLSNI